MAMPSVRESARGIGWLLTVGFVVGALAGGLLGGLGGRLVMLVLRLTSDADGVVTDDGFTIGELTLSGTFQLYAAMTLVGAINGVAYVAARELLPARGRILLWGLVGAAVVGSLVVKTEGVDFTLLEPLWFAVAAFAVLPGLAALVIAGLVERSARIEPWRCSRWFGLLLVPASPALLGAPVFLLGAAVFLGLGRIEALRRVPRLRLARLLTVGLLLALVVAGGVDLTRDALELL